MKQGRFLGDALFVQLVNFLVKPAWLLLIDRGVQNRLPSEAYGNYFSLFAFSLIFSVLLDPGLNSFQNTQYARHPEKMGSGLPAGILLKGLLSLGYLLVLLIGAVFLNLNSESLMWLLWIGLNQTLLSWILYFRSFFTAMHLFRMDALLSAGDKLLAGVLISPVLFLGIGPELNLSIFLGVQSVALFIVLFIAAALLSKRIERVSTSFSQVRKLSGSMFKATWPFALLTALMLLFSRMDAVMLRLLLPDGNEEAGTYALGFRLLEALNMIPALFAGMLLPVFASVHAHSDERKGILQTAWMLMILPALITLVLSLGFSTQWAALIYPNKEAAADMIRFLLPAFLPFSVVYVYGTLLTADQELRSLNILAGIALLLNFVFNFLLIPQWKAQGAAISTLLTQGVFALGCIMLSGKKNWPDFFSVRSRKIWFPLLLWAVLVFLLVLFPAGLMSLVFAIILSVALLIILILPFIRNLLSSNSE